MRNGWRDTTLGEIADFLNGYPFKPSELGEQGLPVIRIQQLLDPSSPVDRSLVETSRRCRLENGDLVFSWSGTLAVRLWDRGPALLNQHLFKVVERHGVDRKWLSYALDHAIDELSRKTHGTTMKHVTKATLLPHTLLLPPLDEQRRIGDLISTVDEGIHTASTVAEAARKARKALLGDLLSDERAMHNGWRVARLGDLSEVIGGGTPPTSTPDFWNGDVVWLTPTEVVAAEGTVVTDSQRKITRTGLRSSGAKLLPPGTVLLTSRATVGAVAMAGCELATNQGFQSLVAGDDLLPWFLLIWIQHNKVEFTRRASGSTFPEISRSEVRRIPILLPPLDEQQRIAGLVKAVDAEADAAEAVAGSMRDVRSALLSDLLAGDHKIPASYDGGMG